MAFLLDGMPEAPGAFSSSSSIPTIVGVSVRCMDIDPQAVINALSQQIGALQTENTILKMALQQAAEANGAPEEPSQKGKRKDAPATS